MATENDLRVEYKQIGEALENWMISQGISEGRAVGAVMHWAATKMGQRASCERSLQIGYTLALVAWSTQVQIAFEESHIKPSKV